MMRIFITCSFQLLLSATPRFDENGIFFLNLVLRLTDQTGNNIDCRVRRQTLLLVVKDEFACFALRTAESEYVHFILLLRHLADSRTMTMAFEAVRLARIVFDWFLELTRWVILVGLHHPLAMTLLSVFAGGRAIPTRWWFNVLLESQRQYYCYQRTQPHSPSLATPP